MRDIQDIIEEYRKSDLEKKRLNLFCEFRELRGEFSEVERKEGFIGIEYIIDAVPSNLTEGETPASNFLSHLKAWKHRFRRCFQESI